MDVQTQYKHLEPRPGSNYRQLFVKGRKIRAEILYRLTVNSEPKTPEQVALDYDLPVEAVREAIHYATRHEDLLSQERAKVLADIQARGPLPDVPPADTTDENGSPVKPSIWQRLSELGKRMEEVPCELPEDLAANHDFYLHGLHKRS